MSTYSVHTASIPVRNPQRTRIIGTELPPMSPLQLLGWKVMGARNRAIDQLWERRLNISTTGQVMIHQADAHLYATFAYSSIFRILRSLQCTSDDVFVDIGCGKGRVVACAATLSMKKAMGVDLDESLCRQARFNAERMRCRRTPIDIIHAPAQEVDYSDCTKFFLFNPFGESTLRQVIASIQSTLIARPRRIDLAYVNPVHDDVLQQTDGFELRDQWQWKGWSGLKHDVSFWKCKQSRP